MATQSPKDIQKRTFDFAIRMVKLVDRLPRTLAAIEIGRQILRSGTSVGANVQEAEAAESKKDFVHKLGIARKEVQETRYWLGIIRVAILCNDAEVEALFRESDELARILYTIARNTRLKQYAATSALILSFVTPALACGASVCSFVILRGAL